MIDSDLEGMREDTLAAVTVLAELAAALGMQFSPEGPAAPLELVAAEANVDPTPYEAEEGMTLQQAMFGAICQAFGFDEQMLPGTRSKVGGVAKKLADAGYLPDEVGPRAAIYKRKFSNAAFTPTGLLNQWDSCVPDPVSSGAAAVMEALLDT
jgi:hypothetical protein